MQKAALATGFLALVLTAGPALAWGNKASWTDALATAREAPAPTPPPPVAANPAHETAAPTLNDLVAKHAHDNGVPVGLAKAVIKIESGFNPRARNHGALGLMQIKAQTARRVGFGGSPTALLAPETNLQFGMKVLAEAYRASGGDVCRTVAYYQSGRLVHRFSHAQRTYCRTARELMARA